MWTCDISQLLRYWVISTLAHLSNLSCAKSSCRLSEWIKNRKKKLKKVSLIDINSSTKKVPCVNLADIWHLTSDIFPFLLDWHNVIVNVIDTCQGDSVWSGQSSSPWCLSHSQCWDERKISTTWPWSVMTRHRYQLRSWSWHPSVHSSHQSSRETLTPILCSTSAFIYLILCRLVL